MAGKIKVDDASPYVLCDVPTKAKTACDKWPKSRKEEKMQTLVRNVPEFTAGAVLTADQIKTRVLGTPEVDAKSIGECVLEFLSKSTELFAAHVDFIARTVKIKDLTGVDNVAFDGTAIDHATTPVLRGIGATLAERVASYELKAGSLIFQPEIALVEQTVGGTVDGFELAVGQLLLPSAPRFNLATIINALERYRINDADETQFTELIVTQKDFDGSQNGSTDFFFEAGCIYLFGGAAIAEKPSVAWTNLDTIFNGGTVEVPLPEGSTVPDADPVAFE